MIHVVVVALVVVILVSLVLVVVLVLVMVVVVVLVMVGRRSFPQWSLWLSLLSFSFRSLDRSWGPFLESPGNFTGPKSNIQIIN